MNHEDTAKELCALLEEKEKRYGRAYLDVPKMLQILYPNGVRPQEYNTLLTITRILDKIYRLSNNDTTEDPWLDIAGYAFLELRKRGEENDLH